ncbi:DUF6244 family protein [Micromonospora sp. RTGN7]|uniref:DUF6244 family protein n=1 Tax=Micromonospora sp. RTGN7 TaxID=3016526 RepID=UPI0029FEE682|nr:DUF6244 family protein [Micromonospora sp. RTGN7]
MSAAQIIAQLAAAAKKLEEAHTNLMAARQAATEAQALVAGALQGSSGQLTGHIHGLAEAIGQVASRTPGAKQQIQTTIAKVQALGN